MRYTNDRKLNTREKQRAREESVKKLKMKIAKAGLIALVATGAVGGTLGKEISEINASKKIEESANIDVVRSYRNLNSKKMGKYLTNQIDLLYSKYPNLDEAIYEGDDLMQSGEFIKDIYSLYKAHMVDNAFFKKDDLDINDVEVITVDQFFINSDRIQKVDGNEIKKIDETHDEKDKMITGEFLNAKRISNGQGFAKIMYEYLANEYGLDSKAMPSEEIQKKIKDEGFYYNQITGEFYSKSGIAVLVDKSDLEKNNEKTNDSDYFIDYN